MADRWKQRWTVPSHSQPGIFYVVAVDIHDQWGCSCPRWKYKREQCKHIQEVRFGRTGSSLTSYMGDDPILLYGNCQQVTAKPERVFVVPLVPQGDALFETTVVYDLLKAGVTPAQIERYLKIPVPDPKEVYFQVISQGRKIYAHRIGPLWVGSQIISVA